MSFSGLPSIISQKIELFIATVVRISNPAQYDLQIGKDCQKWKGHVQLMQHILSPEQQWNTVLKGEEASVVKENMEGPVV
jgi:hypothetical protein